MPAALPALQPAHLRGAFPGLTSNSLSLPGSMCSQLQLAQFNLLVCWAKSCRVLAMLPQGFVTGFLPYNLHCPLQLLCWTKVAQVAALVKLNACSWDNAKH